MTSALSGLLTKAQHAARRRGQRYSTGHMLLAMLQDPGSSVGSMLACQGVREIDLIDSLSRVEPEAGNAIELTLERARKLAVLLGDTSPRDVHLLLAITREARSSGHRCLERLGTTAQAVQEQAIATLQATGARTTALGFRSPPAAPPSPSSLSALPTPSIRRPHSAPPSASSTSTPPLATSSTPLTTPRPNRRVRPPLHVPRSNEKPTARRDSRSTQAPHEAAQSEATQIESANEPTFTLETSGSLSPFALDPRRFPVLTTIGRNLSELAAARKIDPVIGRDREIEQLQDILARRRANNPVLVGSPGVGKTAVVEGLAIALHDADQTRATPRLLIELSVGSLVAGTSVRGALAERLRALRAEVAESNGRVLLFIDEIHALIGAQDGPDSLANELKTALARGELPCIGATTEVEYRRVFERDPALSRRFSRVEIAEPTPDAALQILRGIALEYEKHHGVAYRPEALAAAVDMSVRYIAERQLPDKAIGLIDQAAARARRRGASIVDVDAVAKVVAELTGVPSDRLLMRDADRLLNIEDDLRARVIGQDHAMAAIGNALRKGAAGLRGQRPLGTFLFLGSTGVGKTETAKAIHELLFPAREMTRLDMSEFSEAHAVARLLGAPPGYLGHDEGGQLTEAVRLRPYQLVLLDEIEKAHPSVLLALLPLLDEGRLTDARGRIVSFRNTVIVLTSNLGVAPAAQKARLGFGDVSVENPSKRDERDEAEALQRARAALAPELWNRIDEPLWFRALPHEAIAAIAQSFVERLAEIVKREHAIDIHASSSAIETLVKLGHDATLGARPMKRAVGRLVEAPLAKAILAGEVARGGRVVIEGNDDSIALNFSA